MVFWESFSRIINGRDIKPAQIAAMADISKNTVYQWQKGSSPSLDKLIPIADILNVSLDDLAGRTPPSHTEQEARLLYLFRDMSEKERDSLLEFLETSKLIFKSSKK